MPRTGWALSPRVGYHLCWAAPLIVLVGVPALLITRAVYGVYYPQNFVTTVPSISETAAYTPSADIFQWMMFIVTLCIFVCWPLNYSMNAYRLRVLARPGARKAGATFANAAATFMGILAGVFLALLGIVRLHDSRAAHDLHIELSILFYGSQVIAFLFDGWAAVRLRRICVGLDSPAEKTSLRSRAAIGFCTLIASLWFLYLYLDRDGFWSLYVGQQIYVATEYTLAILCLAYPVAPFPEARRHFRLRAEQAFSAAHSDTDEQLKQFAPFPEMGEQTG